MEKVLARKVKKSRHHQVKKTGTVQMILDKTVTSSRRPDDDHEEQWKKRDSSTGPSKSKSKYFNPPEKLPNPRSLHAKKVKKRKEAQDQQVTDAQERKDLATLLAECRKLLPEEEQQQPGTSATKTTRRPGSNKEDESFSFAENEDTYSTAEAEVAEYLKSGATGIDTLNQFPMIKKLSLKLNAATPSSNVKLNAAVLQWKDSLAWET
ncbi:unnamed protein product [Arctogadus glacialis]